MSQSFRCSHCPGTPLFPNEVRVSEKQRHFTQKIIKVKGCACKKRNYQTPPTGAQQQHPPLCPSHAKVNTLSPLLSGFDMLGLQWVRTELAYVINILSVTQAMIKNSRLKGDPRLMGLTYYAYAENQSRKGDTRYWPSSASQCPYLKESGKNKKEN